MQQLSRMLRYVKVAGGNAMGYFLRALFCRRLGSAARLRQGLSDQRPQGAWRARTMLGGEALPMASPELFVDGPAEKPYLDLIAWEGQRSTTAAGIISADSVDVALPAGVHVRKGEVLEEGLLGVELLMNPKYVFFLETIRFRGKSRHPEAVLLTLPWHHNLYHWMIETLPRLLLYDRAPELQGLKLIVPRSSPGFVRETLELTGYLDRVSFLDDGVYRFEKLHILSRLSRTSDVHPLALDWLRRKMPDADSQRKRRIYVSRADAKIRFIANEAEVQQVLAEYGFETVIMTQHPFRAQIEMFRQAEIVVGCHGAAFSHAAFMPPGSTLIECFEPGLLACCYARLAMLNKLKYGFLMGEKRGLGFAIEAGQLRSVLERALR